MKIAINLLPYRTYQGTETFIVNLTKALIEEAEGDKIVLIKHNHSPDWLDFEGENVEEKIVNFPFLTKGTLALYQQTGLYFLLNKIKPDVLFAPSPSTPIFYPKTYMTIHDCAYDRFPEFSSLASKIYFKSMFYAAKLFAKGVITVSNFSKKELMDVYNIKRKKIHVISEGPPSLPEIEEGFVEKTKEKFNIKGPYLFYIGISRPRKNIAGMLKAFKKFQNKNKDYQFVLAGKEDKRFIDINKKIQQLGLEGQVIKTGFVSEKEKVALYKGAEALFFTTYYEGFGLPVLEAQSLGTPVLTSNTSSLPEVAGKGALLVDPYDADDIAKGLEKITKNKKLRKKITKNGKENLKRFSWNKSANRLLRTIKKEP